MRPVPPPSAAALFFCFLTIGLQGFGGVMPWARRQIVERRAWLTPSAYDELFGLCQLTPGANVANLATVYGGQVAGPIGAAASLAGLLAAPVALALVSATLVSHFSDLAIVRGALRGLAAGGAGLIIATACRMALPWRMRPTLAATALPVMLLVGPARLPLLVVLLPAVPILIAVAALDA